MIDRLMHLRARTRVPLVFIAGLLAGLAFAPTYLVPLWPMGLGLTLALLYRAVSLSGRFWLAFSFSYGACLSGLYWISLAPTADPSFYFVVPFALVLLPALTALFSTLALFLASLWRPNTHAFGWLAIGAYMLLEWRRGIDFTGFGWNRAGMIWTVDPVSMQAAAWGGVALLSLVSLLCAVGVCWWLLGHRRLGGVMMAVPVLLLLSFGAVRLALNPMDQQETLAGVNVRLVQANVPKNTHDGYRVVQDHLDITLSAPLDAISHVIWPEGSTREFLDQNDAFRTSLSAALQPADFSLIFGRRWLESGDMNLSAYLINNQHPETYETYDKANLVPFGEYIPFSSLFERLGFRALTGGFARRVPGLGPKTLTLPGSPPVGVFICYDSIYSGQIVDQKNRPAWLVTITEDAWYILSDVPLLAKTPGPYQHLAEARLRAVEEGLSVARASNPGITTVIDPFGRFWSQRLHLSDAGYIDSDIPASGFVSLFSRIGLSNLYVIIGLISFIASFLAFRRARH